MTDDSKSLIDSTPSNLTAIVYDDVINPIIQPSIPIVADTLKSAVRVAVAPIRGLIWGFDQIIDYVEQTIPAYFDRHKKGSDKVVSPDPQIAVPLIESMRYTASKEDLRLMYSNILGAAMDSDIRNTVLPSFVSAVREFDSVSCVVFNTLVKPSPESALSVSVRLKPMQLVHNNEQYVLQDHYVPYSFPEVFAPHLAPEIEPLMVSIALRNMQRLGLIVALEAGDSPLKAEKYDSLYKHPYLIEFAKKLDNDVFELLCVPLEIHLTDYGRIFAHVATDVFVETNISVS